MNADDTNGESCMQEYGNDDHAVDGAFDEAQDQRPSAVESITKPHSYPINVIREANLRGFILVEFFIG